MNPYVCLPPHRYPRLTVAEALQAARDENRRLRKQLELLKRERELERQLADVRAESEGANR